MCNSGNPSPPERQTENRAVYHGFQSFHQGSLPVTGKNPPFHTHTHTHTHLKKIGHALFRFGPFFCFVWTMHSINGVGDDDDWLVTLPTLFRTNSGSKFDSAYCDAGGVGAKLVICQNYTTKFNRAKLSRQLETNSERMVMECNKKKLKEKLSDANCTLSLLI